MKGELKPARAGFSHLKVFVENSTIQRYNHLLKTGMLAEWGLTDGDTPPNVVLGVILDNALSDLERATARKRAADLATPSPTDAASAGADLRADAASSTSPGPSRRAPRII